MMRRSFLTFIGGALSYFGLSREAASSPETCGASHKTIYKAAIYRRASPDNFCLLFPRPITQVEESLKADNLAYGPNTILEVFYGDDPEALKQQAEIAFRRILQRQCQKPNTRSAKLSG